MKNIVLAVVGVVVVGSFIYFTLLHTPAAEVRQQAVDSAAELSVVQEATPQLSEPMQGTGTLESLRLLGKDMECTVTYVDEAAQTSVEGTYFVSAGDMRGDFLTDAPDFSGQILTSMIIDQSETLYIWSEIEGVTYGISAPLVGSDVASEAVRHEPVSRNVPVQYDCKPWKNVDRTVFEPPQSVLFQNVSELQRGMEYGTVYEEELPIVPEMP